MVGNEHAPRRPRPRAAARSSPACSRGRVTTMRRPKSGRSSNQRELLAQRRPRAPTTRTAGGARPAARHALGERRGRRRDGAPGAERARAGSTRRRRRRVEAGAISAARIAPELAHAHQEDERAALASRARPRAARDAGSLAPAPAWCPVTIVTSEAWSRCGRAGCRRRPARRPPTVTPGTISNGIPARAQRQRLLAAAPEDEGIAALQAHDRSLPARARSISSADDRAPA